MLSLVPEEVYSKERAYTTANYGKPDKSILRNAPPIPLSPPLINPVKQEGQHIYSYEVPNKHIRFAKLSIFLQK